MPIPVSPDLDPDLALTTPAADQHAAPFGVTDGVGEEIADHPAE
jgi:hypothetical protein